MSKSIKGIAVGALLLVSFLVVFSLTSHFSSVVAFDQILSWPTPSELGPFPMARDILLAYASVSVPQDEAEMQQLAIKAIRQVEIMLRVQAEMLNDDPGVFYNGK